MADFAVTRRGLPAPRRRAAASRDGIGLRSEAEWKLAPRVWFTMTGPVFFRDA